MAPRRPAGCEHIRHFGNGGNGRGGCSNSGKRLPGGSIFTTVLPRQVTVMSLGGLLTLIECFCTSDTSGYVMVSFSPFSVRSKRVEEGPVSS